VLPVLCLALIAFGIYYGLLLSISSDDVPIVTRTPSEEIIELPTLDPHLEILKEEPDDITEDIDDPIPGDAQKSPIYRQEPIEEDIINILIVGTDALGSEGGGTGSDAMMLFSYDVKNNKASLISFCEHIWGPVEGYGYDSLDNTYTLGGVGLTINTINALFDLDIQDYVIVDFEGIVELVDKLGGIELSITDVEANYYNKHFGWGIEKGINKLDGERTLIHARNRKSNSGDFERTRRQRDIMLAIFKKIMSARDAQTISDFVGYAMNNMQTNMQPAKIFSLALAILNNSDLNINQGRVPADGTWKEDANLDKDGKSVLAIDFEKNKEYLQSGLYMDRISAVVYGNQH
jgi:LCP family protein required for cell wall assembly